MLLLAAVITSAALSAVVGMALWRRGAGGERLLAVCLLLLAGVFAWIATTPHVGGLEAHIVATAPAAAGPAAR